MLSSAKVFRILVSSITNKAVTAAAKTKIMKNERILDTMKAVDFEKKYPGIINRYAKKAYRHSNNSRVYGIAVSGTDETEPNDYKINLMFQDGTMVEVDTLKGLRGQ